MTAIVPHSPVPYAMGIMCTGSRNEIGYYISGNKIAKKVEKFVDSNENSSAFNKKLSVLPIRYIDLYVCNSQD